MDRVAPCQISPRVGLSPSPTMLRAKPKSAGTFRWERSRPASCRVRLLHLTGRQTYRFAARRIPRPSWLQAGPARKGLDRRSWHHYSRHALTGTARIGNLLACECRHAAVNAFPRSADQRANRNRNRNRRDLSPPRLRYPARREILHPPGGVLTLSQPFHPYRHGHGPDSLHLHP